ncbi:hypothetical protein LINGRAHAP2_LOCUS27895 [Linum grandiflorum]
MLDFQVWSRLGILYQVLITISVVQLAKFTPSRFVWGYLP